VYTSAHSAAGIGIVMAGHALAGPGGAAVASLAAFASHDVLDRIGEAPYGGLKATLAWEAPAALATVAAALLSGLWGAVALGWVAGNMMDLIDKRLGASVIAPDVYPPRKTFACHRRAPDIQISRRATKVAAALAAAAILAMAGAV